jgi:hypothetical protein
MADTGPASVRLPEAPFSATVRVIISGYEWLVTVRPDTPDGRGGLDRMAALAKWLTEHDATPVLSRDAREALAPAPPAPDVADDGTMTQVYQVTSLKVVTTETGTVVIRAFGGPYTQYGVIAWPEVCDGLLDVSSRAVGASFDPPPEAAYMAVLHTQGSDGKWKPKKVTAFRSAP